MCGIAWAIRLAYNLSVTGNSITQPVYSAVKQIIRQSSLEMRSINHEIYFDDIIIISIAI